MAERSIFVKLVANFAQARKEVRRAASDFEDLDTQLGSNVETTQEHEEALDDQGDALRSVRTQKDANKSVGQRAKAEADLAEALFRVKKAEDDLNLSVENSRKELQRSTRDSDRLSRTFRCLGIDINGVAQNARNMFAIFRLLKIPVIITGIHALTGAISALGAGAVALVSSLGPVVGLVGAMPGGIVALTQSIGALAAAFVGLGDALKAHIELQNATDPRQVIAANEKLRESYKSLSPEAQNFVETLAGMRSELTALRKSVQGEVLPGMGDAVRNARPLLATLTGALGRAHTQDRSCRSGVGPCRGPVEAGGVTSDGHSVKESSFRVKVLRSASSTDRPLLACPRVLESYPDGVAHASDYRVLVLVDQGKGGSVSG